MLEKNMDEELEAAIQMADEGRHYWIELLKDRNIGNNDLVVVLAAEEFEYNYYTLLYLKEYQKQKKIRKVVILSALKGVEQLIKICCDYPVEFVKCDESIIESICKLYITYKFSSQIIINTYKLTSDVNGGNLIGWNGISEKDIVAISILGLSEVPLVEEVLDGLEKDKISKFFYEKNEELFYEKDSRKS